MKTFLIPKFSYKSSATRAGLGYPPEKFTTNRSKQTNRVIQEFVQQECKGKKNVDEFSFCVALSKLINTQKQQIELAILGNGEFRLREKFRFLELSPERWCKMNEHQKEKALEKIHTTTLEESVLPTIKKKSMKSLVTKSTHFSLK